MRTLLFNYKFLFFLFTLLFLSSCSSDDDSSQENMDTESSINAKVNGINFDFNFGPNAILLETIAPSFFIFISGSDISIENEDRFMQISLHEDIDFAVFQSGTEWNSDVDEAINVTYHEVIGERDIEASTDDQGSVTVKITFIDKANRIVSGEFSGNVYDSAYDEWFEIENGVFQNIEY